MFAMLKLQIEAEFSSCNAVKTKKNEIKKKYRYCLKIIFESTSLKPNLSEAMCDTTFSTSMKESNFV